MATSSNLWYRELPLQLLLLLLLTISTQALQGDETYSPDGVGNNRLHPEWGAEQTPRIRRLPATANYKDGTSDPLDEDNSNLPSARRVMERIFRVARPHDDKAANHLLLEFGHFIVQDIMADTFTNASEPKNIPCDGNVTDLLFCPATGRAYNMTEIPFERREHVQKSTSSPRATLQGQTHVMDLSNVYGHTKERAERVRGENGKLKLDSNGLVFRETIHWDGMNRSPGAFALYIVFMRYHNMLAELHARDDLTLTADDIYFLARQRTIAVYQSIAEEKYIPSLIGHTLGEYQGYDETINPSVDEFFASVSFRYAHSSLSGVIRVLDNNFVPTSGDPLYLRDIFKQLPPNDIPSLVERHGGIEPFLRGLIMVPAKAIDASIVDDLNIWSEATSVLDVQRARDVGIPSYNDARAGFGLVPLSTMEELAGDDAAIVEALKDLYHNNISLVDAYVGALLEPHDTIIDSMGPMMTMSIKDQFTRLRDGDRFWYKNVYGQEEYENFPTLTEVIRSVCDEMDKFPTDVFQLYAPLLSSNENGVDGVCQPSSSQLSLLGGSLFIGWEVDDPAFAECGVQPGKNRTIDVTIRANEAMEGPGFLGVGWGSKRMLGADIWFCTVTKAEFDAYDGPYPSECDGSSNTDGAVFSCCLAPGDMHSVPKCSSNGDSVFYELEVVGWCLARGSSSVTVRAPVCDKDSGIAESGAIRDCFQLSSTSDEKMDFIVAFNPWASNRPHGYQRRSAAQVDMVAGILTQSETPIADVGMIATHGIFMLISWMVLAPVAIFIVRFMKARRWRMVAHIGIMGVVGSLMIPLLIGIEASVGATSAKSEHKIVGLSMMLVYFLMAFAGRVRYRKLTGKKIGKTADLLTHYFHRYVGTVIVILAWWNCYTGLVRISPEDSYVQIIVLSSFSMGYDMPIFGNIRKYVFFPYIGMVIAIFAIAEVRQRRSRSANASKLQAVIEGKESIWDDDGEHLESMNVATFLDVSKHTALCVVDGRVLDITDFMEIHPGGKDLLRFAQGSDITEEVLGHRDVDGIKHAHGSGALMVMKRLTKAKLIRHGKVEESSQFLAHRKYGIEDEKRLSPSFGLNAIQSHSVFLPGRVVSLKYLTPSLEIDGHSRPVFWLQLAICQRKDKICEDGGKTPLIPSSAFTFRGTDERGHQIERQYSPVSLNGEYNKEHRGQIMVRMSQVLEGIAPKKDSKEEIYDFIISLVPGGLMSKHFLQLKPNKIMLCQGPMINQRAVRKISKNWQTVVMLAAGTGISPMLQMVDSYMDGGLDQFGSSLGRLCPQIFLIWIIKSPEHNYADVLCLDARARRSHGKLKYTIIYSSSTDSPSSSETGSEITNDANPESMDPQNLDGSFICRVKKIFSSDRAPPSSSTANSLIDNTPTHRAKQTLKSKFAKESMNVQDLIETAHRSLLPTSMESEGAVPKSSKASLQVDFNIHFWKENGRTVTTHRLNKQLWSRILQSIQDYSQTKDPKISTPSQLLDELEAPQSGQTILIDDSEASESARSVRVFGDSLSIDSDVVYSTQPPSLSQLPLHHGNNDTDECRDKVPALYPRSKNIIQNDDKEQDVELGHSMGSDAPLYPRHLLLAMSGSPSFEMSVFADLQALGFPKDQITNFGASKLTLPSNGRTPSAHASRNTSSE